MRTSVHVLAALAAVGFTAASAQNTGNPAATPGTQTPVQQPRTSPPPSTPTPSTRTSPTPSEPTQSSSQVTSPSPSQTTQPSQATQQAQPNAANTQQTVRPPDSARTNNANTRANDAANNPAQQNQSRVPPAMRGVGTTGNRPDCTRLRGIEKAECERRDTSRDDLPAGVTTTQPERPPE